MTDATAGRIEVSAAKPATALELAFRNHYAGLVALARLLLTTDATRKKSCKRRLSARTPAGGGSVRLLTTHCRIYDVQ